MRKWLIVFIVGALAIAARQNSPSAPQPLPLPVYNILRDSCTQIDVVFSAGTSMSLEGRNVVMFSSFVDWHPAPLSKAPQVGFLMWQRNGREFLTGQLYITSDSSGYLLFHMGKQQFVNRLTAQGAGFLKKQAKQ
ncbi:MAG: hypothetical protein U0T73_08050 [Chitinophagales bacterium]